MHRGYIKLWRKSFDNPFYLSEPFTKWQAWQDLILLANYTDRDATFRGVNVLVKRGQAAVGEKFLADRWQWKSRGKVKRFLNLLESRQQIVQQNSNVITLVSICNYDEYQPNDTAGSTASEQQTNSKRTASEQQTDTPKKVKKGEKGNNTSTASEDDRKEVEEFWLSHRKRKLTGKRLNAFKRLWDSFDYKKGRADAIDAFLDIPSLTDALMDEICLSAKAEGATRQATIDNGNTPKMLQGWISGRRWEDETLKEVTNQELRRPPTQNELLGID